MVTCKREDVQGWDEMAEGCKEYDIALEWLS